MLLILPLIFFGAESFMAMFLCRRLRRPVKATRCAGALRAALTGRRAGWGTATTRWGRVVVSIVLERTMQVGDPQEEIEKVAQAGIRGMVGALGTTTCDGRCGAAYARGMGRVEPGAFAHW